MSEHIKCKVIELILVSLRRRAHTCRCINIFTLIYIAVPCSFSHFLLLQEQLKSLSELEDQFEELNGWGQLLIKECVPTDGEVIQQKLDDLRMYCDGLSSVATERLAALEESLLSLGQFEGAYDDLWVWLVGATVQLEEFEPITGDPDAVHAQLAKHKVRREREREREGWEGITLYCNLYVGGRGISDSPISNSCHYCKLLLLLL